MPTSHHQEAIIMSEISTPRVSVVIPVYNSMPYLTETLQSLLAQDIGSFEIIAVNDGSTDGSGEELDRFAALDARVTVAHQENSGWPGMPRNRGMERARGEFVFFMDSDDTMAPEALRLMVEQVDAAPANAPIDIVIPRFAGTGGRKVQALFLRHPHGPITLARAMETLSPQKLFRREMLERDQLRFPEEKVRLEDGIFVTRSYVIARGIAFCGAAPLYFIAHRADGQNISIQRIDPVNYVGSCHRIAQTLVEGLPDRAEADRLVFQFFLRKGLRFYVPKRWGGFSDELRATWVRLHQEFLRDRVPAALDQTAPHPTERKKLALIRAGRVAALTALIDATPRLAHSSVCVGSRDTGDSITLEIAIAPVTADSLVKLTAPISQTRLALVRLVNRALRPATNIRAVRGTQRWLANRATAGAPIVRVLLQGRRNSALRTVTGALVRSDEKTGALTYRFVLSQGFVRSFGQDRVDLWTVVEPSAELSGDRVRVRADAQSSASKRGRIYTTIAGSTSLKL